MRDLPILFSAPMVRAILDGRKTQTRRAFKPQPEKTPSGLWHVRQGAGGCFVNEADLPYALLNWTKFEVGGRLWVRETVRADELESGLDGVRYLADGAFLPIENSQAAADRWLALRHYRGKRGVTVPPIHMPRWASRLTLIVKDVRVERLKSISEEDALAEGIKWAGSYPDADGDPRIDPLASCWNQDVYSADPSEVRSEDDLYDLPTSAKGAFARLWRQINGDEAWTSNPWVVVVTFEAVKANIDAIERAAA